MKYLNKRTVKYAFIRSLPVMAGYLILGAGFGILLSSKGYGALWALAMSTFIYAGSMQYVAVEMLAESASIITVGLMTLAVNARHLIYGISMLGKYRNTGKIKPYLIFSLTDETYSVLCDGETAENINEHGYYFFLSAFNHLYWIAGSVVGSLLGQALPVSSEGIEFSMTALFTVVVINQWMSTKNHFNALLGAGSSLICLVLFGADSFIIPAMLSIVLGLCLADVLKERRASNG